MCIRDRLYNEKPKTTRNHFTVSLEPVGLCGKRPASLAEVKAAGRRILFALQFLHNNNWVHRDLRPSNVMFANGDWYLMDLEWANYANAELGVYAPHQAWTPPEITDTSCEWTCLCDMWQFAKLVEAWGHLDDDGRAYVRVQAAPSERLDAEASLGHAFFV